MSISLCINVLIQGISVLNSDSYQCSFWSGLLRNRWLNVLSCEASKMWSIKQNTPDLEYTRVQLIGMFSRLVWGKFLIEQCELGWTVGDHELS